MRTFLGEYIDCYLNLCHRKDATSVKHDALYDEPEGVCCIISRIIKVSSAGGAVEEHTVKRYMHVGFDVSLRRNKRLLSKRRILFNISFFNISLCINCYLKLQLNKALVK